MHWLFNLEREEKLFTGNWIVILWIALVAILFTFAHFAPKEPYNPNPPRLHVADSILPDVIQK